MGSGQGWPAPALWRRFRDDLVAWLVPSTRNATPVPHRALEAGTGFGN
ncbi:MAG: hypothetical protein ACT4PT_12785 [Methanobacteriota archaeon]